MLRKALIVGSLAMAAGSVFAQNLLVNPGFDNPDQLTGWSCTMTHGQPSWSSHDSLGSPDSGSMEHYVAATSNNQTVMCSQCVPVTELWVYVMSGWYFWPDDLDVSQIGTSRWSFVFYSDIDCTSSLGVSATKVGFHPALDTWYPLVTEEVTAPPGSVSARVSVFTWQDLANEPVRARLDDLDFSAVFLFRDGFETGDLSEWSSAVGLQLAYVNWYTDGSCASPGASDGPFDSNYCYQMPGESTSMKFDCSSESFTWYWDDQCTSVRAAGCGPDVCCAVPFSATLNSLMWTCS